MRKLSLDPDALEDFDHWLRTDRKILVRIFELLRHIQRDPFAGIGKPEPLRHGLKRLWSRRINQEHRLIYSVDDEEILIVSCRFHYKR